MNLVVLNAGSGSQRCSLFKIPESGFPEEPLDPVWEARLDATAPGQPEDQLVPQIRRGIVTTKGDPIAADTAPDGCIASVFSALWTSRHSPLGGPADIHLVAHRVVHGGSEFRRAARLTPQVEEAIEKFAAFAPLHNPVQLAGIRVVRDYCGGALRQAAVFDTAFHQTLPDAAFTYAGPHEWRDQGIRRYGFHGTSFRWASERAAELMGRSGDPNLRLIICHLAGGCSLCATRGGRSIDTTMGFTPLDGIAMSTRSGTIDPGILIYLMRQGASPDELEDLLNRRSGLKGLSGLSGDTRVLLPKVLGGHAHAALAMDVFVHRLRQGIGQMLASLGDRPDAFVFTDVMAENEPAIRSAACRPFGFLGLQINEDKNRASPPDADVSAWGSRVKVLIVHSREAWQIARESYSLFDRHAVDPAAT